MGTGEGWYELVAGYWASNGVIKIKMHPPNFSKVGDNIIIRLYFYPVILHADQHVENSLAKCID